MPRKLITPNELELTHADVPGWFIHGSRALTSVMDSLPRAITVVPPMRHLDSVITSSQARCLAAMLGDAADFADGLD